MLRYSLEEFVTNSKRIVDDNGFENILKDTKGFTLNDWLDYGIVGWDKN